MSRRADRPIRLPDISTLHGVFAQARVQPDTVTIFKGWTRLTTDNHGEIHQQEMTGLFCGDTRFLTRYQISVNGEPVSHRLSAQLSACEWTSTGAVLHSGDSGNLDDGTLPRGALEIRMLRKVGDGIAERLFVKNNGIPARSVHLTLLLACPITDSEFNEEMKTVEPGAERGLRPQVSEDAEGLRIVFERNFGTRKNTPTEELRAMYGDQAPRDGEPVTRKLAIRLRTRPGSATVHVRVEAGEVTAIHASAELGARDEVCLELAYEPEIDGVRMAAPELAGLAPVPLEEEALPGGFPRIRSGNSTFNLIVGQAMSDLATLRLPIFGETPLPAKDSYTAYTAGIPRYIGLFGRDNVIAGWQGLLFQPEYLEGALARLSLLQGVRQDDFRDEERFRMPHERRLNPDAQTGEVNRNLYYGDVTSTPFWVLALAALYQWTGDREMLRRHRRTLENCCEWITRRLKQGSGLIYYAPDEPDKKDENRNQAWKDSGDAIVDETGRIRVPPLALAEIQGYSYLALRQAADLLESLDAGPEGPGLLRESAARLKARFNKAFWVEEDRFYALALDHGGQPLRARASNIGHCLNAGIIAGDRVEAVVRGLMSDDLFSGWGIRTLSSDNPGYDPFSYHRGSVWPVENAIIADGMADYGFRDEANALIGSQLCLAALFQHMRLPEVIGGQPRDSDHPLPGIYNFANLLQTWSVTAIAQFVQTLLGLQPRMDQGVVYLDPVLPEWLPWITLENLRFGESSISIRAWREDSGKSRLEVLKQAGGIRIETVPPFRARTG